MITLEMMPPMMFGGLVLAMLIGFPVAFTLAAVGLSFGFLAIHLGFFDLNFLQAIPGRVFGSVLSNELLLAIPFFTFMGAILERCGLAEDMLDSMGQLFGPTRGGLGYSVIIVGFIFGAVTCAVAVYISSAVMGGLSPASRPLSPRRRGCRGPRIPTWPWVACFGCLYCRPCWCGRCLLRLGGGPGGPDSTKRGADAPAAHDAL